MLQNKAARNEKYARIDMLNCLSILKLLILSNSCLIYNHISFVVVTRQLH